jgi:hypothetical protein
MNAAETSPLKTDPINNTVTATIVKFCLIFLLRYGSE